MANAKRDDERKQTPDHDAPGARGGAEASGVTGFTDWPSEESWWRQNFASRSYARADKGFEHHQPAYRYGFESAGRHRGRNWGDVESDLRGGWDSYEHRGANASAWDEIKDSVRDAWDRATGRERTPDSTRWSVSEDRTTS